MLKTNFLRAVILFAVMVFLPYCNGEDTGETVESQGISTAAIQTRTAGNARNDGGGHVLLQAFHWDSARAGSWYNTLKNNAGTLSNAGITMVWTPPPWKDESQWGAGRNHWGGNGGGGGEGYFWCNFDLNGRYGSETDLNNMISTMNSNNIKVIVDVVANHADRKHPNAQWSYNSNKWQANGGTEWGYQFSSDSEIHTGNAYQDIKNALMTLKNKGVAGWRYDVCHGYPSGRVLGWNQDTGADFALGEFDWSGSYGGKQMEDWCDESQSTAFDWYLKWNLNSGNPSTFGGLCTNSRADARARAVTFVENHDTQTSRGNGNAAPDDSMGARSKAYAFILAAPGTPCVYWTDLMDGGVGFNWLKSMIWARRNAGIKADSAIVYNEINGSGKAIIVQGSNHNLALALDWPGWAPSGGNWTKNNDASGWNGYLNVWSGSGNGGGGGGGGGGGNMTLKMTKDVGIGSAIFFTGGINELTNWGTGVQGTWQSGNVWEVSINNPNTYFEWKVRKGSYGGSGNQWESGGNHDSNNLHPSFNGGF